jgi:glycosyltransferase involved in cell wall biosynthesis
VKRASTDASTPGVSFVVPVHNGAACIRKTLESIYAQADGRPFEVIVVDDRSSDESSSLLQRLQTIWPFRIIEGPGRGAAAAMNIGIRAARYPLIAQVDQDVVLGRGWLARLLSEFTAPDVGAVQGYYATDPAATLVARVMGFDLEQRYAAIGGAETEHVCTGNSVYRLDALQRVGLFDEALGYGSDNDMSYRLREAGYRLRFCRTARSLHRWRDGFVGYCVQQYGFGYGRLDVVAKYPRRIAGDSVSRADMMAHPVLTAAAIAASCVAMTMAFAGGPWRVAAICAAAVVSSLAAERWYAGVRAAIRFRDPAPLLFPALHLVRDLVWVAAITVWCTRRALKQPASPRHSMRARRASAWALSQKVNQSAPRLRRRPQPRRTLCLIPAYNEEANLPVVIGEVRASCPHLDILVVDDGSTDSTGAVAERLGVRWLRLPDRMGVGSAMRAGLRYAALLGCEAAVRIDADGQHRAADIDRVLGPIVDGRADVVLGSRFAASDSSHGIVRTVQRTLGACLSALTGNRVTDPTSGFCALGPRAIRVLAEHHPTGYGEAELRLFMSRNALKVVETPVAERARLSGRTTLTPGRLTAAGARALLAMVIVPLRSAVKGAGDD